MHNTNVSPMDITCPHCQAPLTVKSNFGGTTTDCPHCGGKFQIPVPTAFSGGGNQHPDVKAFASKKIAAGICAILFGELGIHKFVLGLSTPGAIMLVLTLSGVFTGACLFFPIIIPIVLRVIAMVEGIIYLTKSDEDFYQTYAVEQKEWF
jgi:TM2 domain-containing membrane protein YozV